MSVPFQILRLISGILSLQYGVYEDPLCMFYANLWLSQDSSELETLVIGTKIILKTSCLKIFLIRNSLGVIPFMNYTCPNNFEVIFEKAKKVVSNL